MATRIDEALEYLGKADHRFYTMLVGGSLLFVSQYVFVWSGRAHIRQSLGYLGITRLAGVVDMVAVAVGLSSLVVVLGYLMLVSRDVAAGEDAPPRFTPLTVPHWRPLLTRGVVAGMALVVTAAALGASLNTLVATVLDLLPAYSRDAVLVGYLYDLLTLFVFWVLFFYGPYVLLAVFLLLGRRRADTDLLSILTFRNRTYLAAWGLMLVLLVFEGNLLSYLGAVVTERRFVQSSPGGRSLFNSFVTFYLLVSIVYLFSDALTDAGEDRSEDG